MKLSIYKTVLAVLVSFYTVACAKNIQNIDLDIQASFVTVNEISTLEQTEKKSSEVVSFDPHFINYLEGLNQSLAENNVPFRYITYEYGSGKFTTYPFNLILEKLPTQDSINKKYDKKYDEAFQDMIFTLETSVDLTNKKLYAVGTQDEGMYVQDIDIDTKKMYVLNKICFDSKCSAGQVFYLFDPINYDMVGMKYDGCIFLKDIVSGENKRMKNLLTSYIDSQDPLEYSYAPNVCK